MQPSDQPSLQPSDEPSDEPSDQPSLQPSDQPSLQPSDQPSDEPSMQPSDQPSQQPSDQPSDQPSRQPSDQPSEQPSDQPSDQPSLCVDEIDWESGGGGIGPLSGVSCGEITSSNICTLFNTIAYYNFKGKNAGEACCFCGGSDYRIVAPSTFPSDEPSVQPSSSSHPSVLSDAPSSMPSDMPSDMPSITPSISLTSAPTVCTDEPSWIILSIIECSDLSGIVEGVLFDNCSTVGTETSGGKTAQQACCACGGGVHK